MAEPRTVDKAVPIQRNDAEEYDLSNEHQWDDVAVKLDGPADPKFLKWGATNLALHRGVAGTRRTFTFQMDAKLYDAALQRPEWNGGVVLMCGDPRFPLLHCWLRPLFVGGGNALFDVSVPADQLEVAYIAFIPNAAGKKRYLYKLSDVVLSLQDRPKAKDEK